LGKGKIKQISFLLWIFSFWLLSWQLWGLLQRVCLQVQQKGLPLGLGRVQQLGQLG
jgi:hypothetical protein